MTHEPTGEWSTLQRLLPGGWQRAAVTLNAFQRARCLPSAAALLRLLLFHAVSDSSLRSTVEAARDAGLASLSDVAFRKRLIASVEWLRWINHRLCAAFRAAKPPGEGRLRLLDGSTIQGPRSTGTEWRLHYTLDLPSLDCDWHHVSDAHTSEALELVPVRRGDVLIADRNFLRPPGVRHVRRSGGHVLVRLKWAHPRMVDAIGRRVRALTRARRLRVGEPGDWAVGLHDPATPTKPLWGRIVALKLPAPLAAQQRERVRKSASKKGRTPDPRSLEAAQFVMLFTTLPADAFDAVLVLTIYRWRWQVEVAFKRLKQLLRLGHLPHTDKAAAQGWILSKLTVALLLEKLYRQARAISPWGYELAETPRGAQPGEPLALVEAGDPLPASAPQPRTVSRRSARQQVDRRRVA